MSDRGYGSRSIYCNCQTGTVHFWGYSYVVAEGFAEKGVAVQHDVLNGWDAVCALHLVVGSLDSRSYCQTCVAVS